MRWQTCRRELLLACLLLLSHGCASNPLDLYTQTKNTTQVQVFLRPPFTGQERSKLVIYSFTQPRYAPGSGNAVTQEFYQELLRSGLYRQVALSSQVPGDPKDTLLSTELKDYDLAMRGKIVHLVAGSGITSSRLTVEVQIMTVHTGTLVWFVRLEGTSETGEDLDLVWHTYSGQNAQPYQALARALAQRFVKVMTPAPEPDSQSTSRMSPPVRDPVE